MPITPASPSAAKIQLPQAVSLSFYEVELEGSVVLVELFVPKSQSKSPGPDEFENLLRELENIEPPLLLLLELLLLELLRLPPPL